MMIAQPILTHPAYYSGKGRGYLNTSIKWLFAQNLQIELILKDLLVNRREASTFTREVRMTYIDHFRGELDRHSTVCTNK